MDRQRSVTMRYFIELSHANEHQFIHPKEDRKIYFLNESNIKEFFKKDLLFFTIDNTSFLKDW